MRVDRLLRQWRVLWITPTPLSTSVTGREAYSRGLVSAAQQLPHFQVAVHAALDGRRQLMRRDLKRASLVTPLPAMCAPSRLQENRQRLLRLLNEAWDIVVVDHLQLGWVIDILADRGVPSVYISHNHEASTKRSAGEGAPWPERAALTLDLLKTRRLERRVIGLANVTTAISRTDAQRFLEDGAQAVHLVYPLALRPLAPKSHLASAPRAVLHFGSFIWSAKLRNLRDLLAVAAPAFDAAGIRLVIAGPGDPVALFGPQGPPPCVEYVGEVDERALDEVFRRCRAAIVAEPRGGGFKMKLLDLVAARLPLYILGEAGSGLRLQDNVSCRMRPTIQELVEACVREIDDLELLTRFQETAATELRRFSPPVVASQLDGALRRALRAGRQERRPPTHTSSGGQKP